MPKPTSDAGMTDKESIDLLEETASLPKFPAQLLGNVLRLVIGVARAFIVLGLGIPMHVTPALGLHVMDIMVTEKERESILPSLPQFEQQIAHLFHTSDLTFSKCVEVVSTKEHMTDPMLLPL